MGCWRCPSAMCIKSVLLQLPVPPPMIPTVPGCMPAIARSMCGSPSASQSSGGPLPSSPEVSACSINPANVYVLKISPLPRPTYMYNQVASTMSGKGDRMSEADQNIGRDPMAGIDGDVCRYWGDANAKEEEWKQARWEYLSASWAGPLMETCPYHAKDADEAGLSMRDMLIRKFKLREDLTVNNAMRHGSYMEPIVIDLWSRITGIPMLRSNAMYVSTRAQNMSCTIDGFVLPDRDFPDAADVGYLEGARDPDEASEKQAWFWPFLERCYALLRNVRQARPWAIRSQMEAPVGRWQSLAGRQIPRALLRPGAWCAR